MINNFLQIDILILDMLMLKAEHNDDKERLQRLRNFIEYLSKKDAIRCRKTAKTIESSHARFAELCIQQLQEMQKLKKQYNSCLDELRALKDKLKNLDQERIRIKEAKGLSLVADKATINTILAVLEMIEKGHYIEAQQKCPNRYPFIQDLIEYASLKRIAFCIIAHQKVHEVAYRYGNQYNTIRTFLASYQRRVERHEKEVQEYLGKIERGEIGEWSQPESISQKLFKLLQRIQFRICNLQNQNRELRSTRMDKNEGFDDDFQEGLILLSSSPNKRYNQCPQDIITKLRSLTVSLQNRSKANIHEKSPEQCLKEIQSELSHLQQFKDIMSKDPNNKEDMNLITMTMDSLLERVKHLEKLQEKGLDLMRRVNGSIESLVKGESKSAAKVKDQDQVFMAIEWNIELLKRQTEEMENYYKREIEKKDREKEEQLANIKEQRDQFRNKLQKINLNQSILQIREEFGLQYKKSENSQPYEALQDRIKELDIQKDKCEQSNTQLQTLIKELQEQNKLLQQKIADDEQSMKTIKQERITFTKQLEKKKTVLNNQLKKIKSLEQQSKISKLSSKKSESLVGDKLEDVLAKSTSQKDCQQCFSQRSKNKELDTKIGNLQHQIKSLTESLDKMTNQKAELNKKMEELIKQNRDTTKKLNGYKDTFENQDQQITKLNIMLNELQQYVEELENRRAKSPSSAISSKSSVIRNTICQTDHSNEIEGYKTKNKELKKRISQLQAKNLTEMQISIKAKKESQAIRKKYEDIKSSLPKVEIRLDEQQKEKEKLRRQYEELKQAFDRKNSQRIERPRQQEKLFNNFKNESSPQHRCLSHLFTAKDVFQYDEPERLHLINILQQQCGPIYQTKLLYHFDPLNKVNFHRYIDNKRHIVTIMKTEYNRIVAAYCESYFSINGTEYGNGLLMPLWDHESVFRVQHNKKANVYDDYYLLYGNSQIRIRSQQNRVFSNFGISNSYFDCQKKKVQDLLGQNQREMNLITYQVYTVIFQRDRD